MSYNGIGLQSARGSGTSGYIQRNVASLKGHKEETEGSHYKKRKLIKKRKEKEEKQISNENKKVKARSEIVDHNNRREIDVKCMELRDELEAESEDEDIVQAKVSAFRKELMGMQDNSCKEKIEHIASFAERDGLVIRNEEAKSSDIMKLNTKIEEKDEDRANDIKGESAYDYKPRYSVSSLKEIRSSARN